MNPGAEKNAPVGAGAAAVYPDLVLHSPERGRRLEAIVEVETGESVNHLEALAEWASFARLRVPFHLYVPAGMADVARQLCADNQVLVNEMWSYHSIGDDVRFALLHRSKESPAQAASRRRAENATSKAAPSRKPVAATAPASPKAKRPAAKRAAAKPSAAKRPAAKAKRPAVRPAKAAAPRRKPAAPKKKSARPQKHK